MSMMLAANIDNELMRLVLSFEWTYFDSTLVIQIVEKSLKSRIWICIPYKTWLIKSMIATMGSLWFIGTSKRLTQGGHCFENQGNVREDEK